jgi:MFS family permease
MAVKLLIAITRGVARDRRARRLAMMAVSLGALAMLFAGSAIVPGWLAAHPGWFLFHWLACAWLTVCSILLALFDLLVVRAEGRRREVELAKEILGNGRGRNG